jgi:putative peptidoglycan lipid II flippase
VVTGIGHLSGLGPAVVGSLVQGMLGGLTVLVVFGGVAFALDRRSFGVVVARLRRVRA